MTATLAESVSEAAQLWAEAEELQKQIDRLSGR